jgi:hypothetical protein
MQGGNVNVQTVDGPRPNAAGLDRWRPLLVVLLIAATVVAIAVGANLLRRPPGNFADVPVNPAVEVRWGVRITRVGVTADGGLVDVRFLIIDPEKALVMLQAVENVPILIAEDSGKRIVSAAMMPPRHDLVAGRTGFILYRDTGGAIRPGTSVTVRFGDLVLEHVTAG